MFKILIIYSLLQSHICSNRIHTLERGIWWFLLWSLFSYNFQVSSLWWLYIPQTKHLSNRDHQEMWGSIKWEIWGNRYNWSIRSSLRMNMTWQRVNKPAPSHPQLNGMCMCRSSDVCFLWKLIFRFSHGSVENFWITK